MHQSSSSDPGVKASPIGKLSQAKGQTVVEYSFIGLLLIGACFVSLFSFGNQLTALFGGVQTEVKTQVNTTQLAVNSPHTSTGESPRQTNQIETGAQDLPSEIIGPNGIVYRLDYSQRDVIMVVGSNGQVLRIPRRADEVIQSVQYDKEGIRIVFSSGAVASQAWTEQALNEPTFEPPKLVVD